MKEKIKAIIVSISFVVIIIGLSFLFFIIPDNEISNSERRTLVQFPEVSIQEILCGEFFEEFESYMLDQFPFRDSFRTMKAFSEYSLFAKADNNNIYIVDGYVCKQDYPLNENAVVFAVEKMNEYEERFFKNIESYYCIIPDKNEYLADGANQLYYSIDSVIDIIDNKIDGNIKNINIKDILSKQSYYLTDLHWQQQEIIPVADFLLAEMKGDNQSRKYNTNEMSPFYGSYFGQAALPIDADKITYLDNEVINACTVYNPVKDTYGPIYEMEAFGGIDSYDVFLSGAESILVIENPNNHSGEELYIIRDSFASSITPLLVESYSRIVLIDPRYTTCESVAKYIQPSDQATVLFLFSTTILNNGYLFK